MEREQLDRFFHAVADRVAAELGNEFPDAVPNFGLEIRDEGTDPRVAYVTARGSAFTWVAFSFPSFDRWDVHVGCVVTQDTNTVQVGFHALDRFSDRLPMPAIKDASEGAGGVYQKVPGPEEQQYVSAPIPLDRPDAVELAAREVVRFYRATAPTMAELARRSS